VFSFHGTRSKLRQTTTSKGQAKKYQLSQKKKNGMKIKEKVYSSRDLEVGVERVGLGGGGGEWNEHPHKFRTSEKTGVNDMR